MYKLASKTTAVAFVVVFLAVVAGAGAHVRGYEYVGCEHTHPRIRASEIVRAHVNVHRVHGAADLCVQRHGATHCYCPVVSLHKCEFEPWTAIVGDAYRGFR
jgi:hypothetical protein